MKLRCRSYPAPIMVTNRKQACSVMLQHDLFDQIEKTCMLVCRDCLQDNTGNPGMQAMFQGCLTDDAKSLQPKALKLQFKVAVPGQVHVSRNTALKIERLRAAGRGGCGAPRTCAVVRGGAATPPLCPAKGAAVALCDLPAHLTKATLPRLKASQGACKQTWRRIRPQHVQHKNPTTTRAHC